MHSTWYGRQQFPFKGVTAPNNSKQLLTRQHMGRYHTRADRRPHTHAHAHRHTHTHAHTRTHTHKHTHAHRPHTHARPHVQLLMLRAACWVCGSRSTVGFLKSVVLCEVRDPGVWLWLVGWVSRAGGEKKGCWNDVVHVWRAFFSTAGGRECVVLPVGSSPLVWCVLAWKSWQHPKVFPGGPPPQY